MGFFFFLHIVLYLFQIANKYLYPNVKLFFYKAKSKKNLIHIVSSINQKYRFGLK